MHMKKRALWTKNFTIITLGTMISAIGGAAMGLGLSLVVFDQTQSTWLSGVYAAVSMVPGMTLPILLGPLLDRVNRKRVIVALDALSGALYLAFLLYIRRAGFVYGAYLLFNLITGSIGSVYSLAYECLYPDLIPEGLAQQGYAVSGLIYPLAITVVTPLAALVYGQWGIEVLFLAEGVLLLVAAAFESRIDYAPLWAGTEASRSPREYLRDMLGGIRYLRREKGVRHIYTYMMITNAAGTGTGMMSMAHFQSSSALTTAMYGLLSSAETIGRLLGSALHYAVNIPEEKRYAVTVRVYMIYEVCDGVLLFLAYPLMLVLRFVCGFLGSQTAALRAAAVQNYLPPDMRARVNGLFGVLASAGALAAQLLTGALGETLPYPVVAALLAGASFVAVLLLIVRNRRDVEPVYNRQI